MTIDGYPEDHELETIRTWDKDPVELMEYIYCRWQYRDWGWKQKRLYADKRRHEPPKMVYYVSTAGWSGNESIIDALQGNFIFWGLYWHQSRAGGHYIFKIPIDYNHICQRPTGCSCSSQGLEPDKDCPVHSGGEWPPRCEICGRFMKWKKE